MENSIILVKKETNLWTQILFTKQEFDLLKNNFYWHRGSDDIITNYEDTITGAQLKIFKKVFTFISEDFNLDQYDISFYPVQRFFTVEKFLEDWLLPLKKGPSRCTYDQIIPIRNKPTFSYGDSTILEWYHEYGAFKKIRLTDNTEWFVHPNTLYFLFNDDNGYRTYLIKRDIKRKKLEHIMGNFNNQFFIRLINVYDKFSKELKYRIVNDEFMESGLNEFIIPIAGDDILLFNSYLVTYEMAEFINERYDNKIDFNFNDNVYYLETLSANDFIYSYEDFVKDLDIIP